MRSSESVRFWPGIAGLFFGAFCRPASLAQTQQDTLENLKKAQQQLEQMQKAGPPVVDLSRLRVGVPHPEQFRETFYHVLTFDEAMRTITATAEIVQLEGEHPGETMQLAPGPSIQGATPKQAIEAAFAAAPQHAAILQKNGLEPFQYRNVLSALERGKVVAERAKTPNAIGNLCHSGGGGGCTVQQVTLIREHYTELKAQWESYDALRSPVLPPYMQVWTHPF